MAKLTLFCLTALTFYGSITVNSQNIFDGIPSFQNMFSRSRAPTPQAPAPQAPAPQAPAPSPSSTDLFRAFSRPQSQPDSGSDFFSRMLNQFSPQPAPQPARQPLPPPVPQPAPQPIQTPPPVQVQTPPPASGPVQSGGPVTPPRPLLLATRTPTAPPPTSQFGSGSSSSGDIFSFNTRDRSGGNPLFLGGSTPTQASDFITAVRAEAKEFISTDDEWLPNLVQLIFHTCIGGCDGCLDKGEHDNIGLLETYDHIRQRWALAQFGSQLSLADYIVMLGTEAAEIGIGKTEGLSRPPSVPFTPGRITCRDPDDYNPGFVFPKGDDTDSLGFLMREFGLSRNQAIALMGAHSLGACRIENIGFAGRWDNTPLVLDNDYYSALIDTPQWVAVPVNNDNINSWQWNSTQPDGPMMLHADLALLKSFTVDERTKQPSCPTHDRCGISKDFGRVQLYGGSMSTWLDDFIPAYVKMASKLPTSRH